MDSFNTKANALSEAILFCKDMGFQNLLFEGDAMKVVNLLVYGEVIWNQGGLMKINSDIVRNDSYLYSTSFTLGQFSLMHNIMHYVEKMHYVGLY